MSNIPLIFTQYRSKVLEESGKQWFHSENNEPCELSTQISEISDITSIPESSASLNLAQSSSDEASHKLPKSEKGLVAVHSSQETKYDYPDPWESEPSETIAPQEIVAQEIVARVKEVDSQHAHGDEGLDQLSIASNAEPAKPNLEVELPKVTTNSESPTVSVAQDDSTAHTKLHPSSNVNLFPFGESVKEETVGGHYDLTEFDNGEIEIPPMAVRDSGHSTFEKVSNSSASGLTPAVSTPQSKAAEPESPLKNNKASHSKPASAEIAKYRLRSCLE